MKKKMFFVVGGIVLVAAIFMLTFYSLNYFDKRQPKVKLNTLEIILSDSGNLDLSDQTPVGNSDGRNAIPYIFKVINKGENASKYQLLIEDYVSDSTKELLSRNVLNFELLQNNRIIKSGNLGSIRNNILCVGDVEAGTEKKYELRIWIDENTDPNDWVGKSYSYNIKVNPIVD